MVAELRPEHVERSPFARGICGIGEFELGLWIVKPLDQPGRRDAVDVGPRARHPRAAPRRQRTPALPALRVRPSLHCAQPLRRRLPDATRPLARGRLEIVDPLHTIQLALHGVELRPQLRDPATVVGLVAVEMTQDFAASLDDDVIFDRAGFMEKPDDVFVRYRLDAVDAKEGRLASDRVDHLDEPLK